MAYITKLEEELELEILQLKRELDRVRGLGKNKIIQGDCLEVLKTLPDNYFDSLITDPPCGISFMGKNWDDHKGGMLQWINWMSEVMAESLRVMKPGACGLVWSIPRTSHWTGMALELAGFRLIDIVHACNGSGFPKGQDISKSIDALYGAEREIIGSVKHGKKALGLMNDDSWEAKEFVNVTKPNTPEAKQWDGWKTPALKPAIEGWWLIQKPISESSIARNILKHGVGGLNIEACRIPIEDKTGRASVPSAFQQRKSGENTGYFTGIGGNQMEANSNLYNSQGRYPANLILSCSADCDGDNHSPDCPVSVIGSDPARYFKQLPFDPETVNSVYYQAKASTKDRTCDGTVENTHPTVKSTALMEYFIKLITPPNGMVLDPFGGSGTTGVAAKNLGFNYTLIEREQEYIEIINQRLSN
jgi:site-specific DNA-methyltransferase (adenine-specific)